MLWTTACLLKRGKGAFSPRDVLYHKRPSLCMPLILCPLSCWPVLPMPLPHAVLRLAKMRFKVQVGEQELCCQRLLVVESGWGARSGACKTVGGPPGDHII